MTLHILPSPEAMSVLENVGFTDEAGGEEEVGTTGMDAGILVMATVDIDKVARLLQVLKEEAKDVGLEL